MFCGVAKAFSRAARPSTSIFARRAPSHFPLKVCMARIPQYAFASSAVDAAPSWGSFLTHAEVAKRFEEFDEDGDGLITIAECKAAMERLEREVGDGCARESMWAWDSNKDGVVDYFEFMDFFLSTDKADEHGEAKRFDTIDDLLQHCVVQDSTSVAPNLSREAKAELIKSFKHLDLDNDGFLDREELTIGLKSMNTDFSTQEIDSTISRFFEIADKNHDGLIDLYEFSTRVVQQGLYR